MKRKLISCIIFFTIFKLYPLEASKLTSFEKRKVRLERADKLEYYKKDGKTIIRGIGNVYIKHFDQEISANEIIAYPETNDIVAVGDVIYKDDSTTMYANRFAYNLDTQVGVLLDGQIFTPTSYMAGTVVHKTGKITYEVQNARYSTCKYCIEKDQPPHWILKSDKLTATIEGYATSTHTTFNILDMPVFYFPWFIFPVKTKRQTGFLPLNLMSGVSGGDLDLGLGANFFWAMNRSMDSTYYYTYKIDHGHKYGFEYRYVASDVTSGDFRYFFINDKSDEYREVNHNNNDNRWAVAYRHKQDFNEDFRLRSRLRYLSDQNYLTHIGDDIEGPEGGSLKSSVVLVYNSENTITTMENSYHYHMSAPNQKDSTHKLPEINYFLTSSPLTSNIPLYFSIDSTFTNFVKERNRLKTSDDPDYLGLAEDNGNDSLENSSDSDGSENNGLLDPAESRRGQRLIVAPEAYLPVNLNEYLLLQPSIRNSTYLYFPDLESHTDRRLPYKNVWSLNVDLSSKLSKNYSLKKTSVKHTVYPIIRYMFRFGGLNKGAHPYFDSYDETSRMQKVAFILDNIFFETSSFGELFQLTLDQRVNIEYMVRKANAKTEEEILEAQQQANTDRVLDPFKVVAKFGFSNIPWFITAITGRSEFYYDYKESDINRVSSQLSFADWRGDSINFTYTKDTRKKIEEANTATEEDAAAQSDGDLIHYVQAGLNLYVNNNYSLSYNNSYSILDKKRHNEEIALYFSPDSKCWNLVVEYKRIQNAKKENLFNCKLEIIWGII